MEILIKNKSIETFLKEVADAWRDLCPTEYEKFRRYIAEESMSLVKPSGMSHDGHFMNFMYLPEGLYPFIKQQARKRLGIDDFFRDSDNYRLLKKVWPDAAVKTHPTQYLYLNHGANNVEAKKETTIT